MTNKEEVNWVKEGSIFTGLISRLELELSSRGGTVAPSELHKIIQSTTGIYDTRRLVLYTLFGISDPNLKPTTAEIISNAIYKSYWKSGIEIGVSINDQFTDAEAQYETTVLQLINFENIARQFQPSNQFLTQIGQALSTFANDRIVH